MSEQPSRPKAQVAVVTRTKNRPLLLPRALQSLLDQTYQDWVAVVVNDAGRRDIVEDAVLAVADRSAGRIFVVHNEVSSGREAALNTGISATSTTYVAVLDDDDTWAPEFLEQTVSHLESSPHPGVAVRTEVVYERIDDGSVIETGRELLASDKHAVTLVDLLGHNHMPPCSLVYRREVHDVVGGYDGSLPVLADWEFYLRFLLRFQIDFIDGVPLAFWHHRPESVGDEGNTVHAGIAEHRLWDTRIRDRYLREELADDRSLGSLLYLSDVMSRDRTVDAERADHLARSIHDLDTAVRIDVLQRVSDVDHQLTAAVQHLTLEIHDHVVAQLRELNANLVAQSNRFIVRFEELERRAEQVERRVGDRTVRARIRAFRRRVQQAVDRPQH